MNIKLFLSILIFANLTSYTYAQFSSLGDLDIIVVTNKKLDDTIDVSATEGSPYENESFVFGKAVSEKKIFPVRI